MDTKARAHIVHVKIRNMTLSVKVGGGESEQTLNAISSRSVRVLPPPFRPQNSWIFCWIRYARRQRQDPRSLGNPHRLTAASREDPSHVKLCGLFGLLGAGCNE